MPIATPSRKWSYAYHESHILTWRFTKRQVGMPYECWLLQAAGNCCGTGKKLRKVWVDGTYRGAEWTAWMKEQYNIVLESVVRAEGQKGFAVFPHRGVVERTWAGLSRDGRWGEGW